MTDIHNIAASVRSGRRSARSVAEETLARIEAGNRALNAFTHVFHQRALADADAVDRLIADGQNPGPLAGVPFGVKNLFDVEGEVTLAGSIVNRSNRPAARDATAVARLRAAGAILVGALNMNEFAYGYTTENSHYGPTRNAHDPTRSAGGSSGGSATAVAAGLIPLALGSDTNGSIRVPAALCGIAGLKPTFGRVSRTGVYPFVASLDHVGVFARSMAEVALVYDLLQGADPRDPTCRQGPVEPVAARIGEGTDGLRIAAADGYFRETVSDEALDAVDAAADALGVSRRVALPNPAAARAAAFVITATESGSLHHARLRTHADQYDPLVRDRLIAGALVPAHWYLEAQRFRRWFVDELNRLFDQVDVVLAPATPVPAPLLGQQEMTVAGTTLPTRTGLGLFVQPLTLNGMPIAVVPWHPPGRLPVGVQIMAAPWREDLVLRVAQALEERGFGAGLATAERQEVRHA